MGGYANYHGYTIYEAEPSRLGAAASATCEFVVAEDEMRGPFLDDEVLFTVRIEVTSVYAALAGAANLELSEQAVRRCTWALIDWGYERGKTYKFKRDEGWKAGLNDSFLRDEDIDLALLQSLKSVTYVAAVHLSGPERVEMDGLSEVLGTTVKRLERALFELLERGRAEAGVVFGDHHPHQGYCTITQTGREYLEKLEQRPQTRTLTVLFMDLRGSTSSNAQSGDKAWQARSGEVVASATERMIASNGRVVSTEGDGALAVFETPVEAIHAALDALDVVVASGLDCRIGVDLGQVTSSSSRPGAIEQSMAVNIAKRLQEDAQSGQVLVSDRVRSVASIADANLHFEDADKRRLKGVPDPQPAFTVARG